NFNGTVTVSYEVSDGHNAPVTGHVTITVRPVDDPPVVTAQSVDTDEDTGVGIALQASDIEGDSLTFRVQTPPAHGTLSSMSGPTLTYTPAADFNGSDSFT